MAPVKLIYDEFGNGAPLIILHGLFGSARNWQRWSQLLSSYFRVVAVDLRNHGRSPHDSAHDYPTMAADIWALADRLNLDAVTLLGHSMGGKVAMQATLLAPARVRHLLVVDIAPVTYADQHTATIDTMLSMPLAQITRRQQADALLANAIPDPTLRLFLLQNLVLENTGARWRLNLPALRTAMPKMIAAPPLPDAQYHGPIDFIRGENSDRVAAQYHSAIAENFPSFQIHTIAGGGHWPHSEAPTEFKAVLGRVLGCALG